MPSRKISDLAYVETLTGTEFWHIVHGGRDRRTSMAQFVEYLTPFLRGERGASVSSARVADDGSLTLTLSDGTTVAVGSVQGPQGPQGLPGPQGANGTQGERGLAGDAGPQGPMGATGPTGAIGPKGDTGAAGAVGATGPQGAAGATGPQGAQGVQGIKGDTGPTGAVGATGATGAKGDQGVQGPQGIQGIKGDAGTRWLIGAGAPSSGTGTDGDLYMDSSSGAYYRRNAGSWFSQGSLLGPQGPQGPTGPQGTNTPAATPGQIWVGNTDTVSLGPQGLYNAQKFQAMGSGTADFSTGINFRRTRTAAETLAEPVGMKEGQAGTIRLDGPGALTFSTSWDFGAAGAPTPSAATGTYDYLDYQVVVPTGGARSIRAFYSKAGS